jgi:hypothetical protein
MCFTQNQLWVFCSLYTTVLASYVHKAREVLDLRPKTAFAHVGVKKAGRQCSAVCGVLEVAFLHHQASGLGFATDMLV